MRIEKSSSKSSKSSNCGSDRAPPRVLSESFGSISIGKIIRSHGLRGDVVVAIHPTIADLLRPGLEVTVVAPDRSFLVVIQAVRDHHGGRLVRVEGIESRTAAETLRGAELRVASAALPAPASREYYDFELIGLPVVSASGEQLGTVYEVIDTGANDVCVIRKGSEELLLPMSDVAVVEIDRPGRRIIVDPCALVGPE